MSFRSVGLAFLLSIMKTILFFSQLVLSLVTLFFRIYPIITLHLYSHSFRFFLYENCALFLSALVIQICRYDDFDVSCLVFASESCHNISACKVAGCGVIAELRSMTMIPTF